METLTNQQIADAGLADWRKLAQPLYARFRSADASSRSAFVTALIELDPPPELHLTGDGGDLVVDVSVATREAGIWVTPRDVETARTISGLAREFGLTAAAGEVTQIELGLDTARDDEVGPFWSALLTGSPANTVRDSVFDPTGRVPPVWFQQSEPVREIPAQRWHFDLWLAPEVAEDRIAAAVAAGGTVVSTDEAPAFTVLADPDGNRVCICTSLERD